MSAIVFSYHPHLSIPGTLHKIEFSEDHEWVEQYWQQLKYNFIQSGYPEFAEELIFVEDVPKKELYKMKEITGYVGVWWTKQLAKHET